MMERIPEALTIEMAAFALATAEKCLKYQKVRNGNGRGPDWKPRFALGRSGFTLNYAVFYILKGLVGVDMTLNERKMKGFGKRGERLSEEARKVMISFYFPLPTLWPDGLR